MSIQRFLFLPFLLLCLTCSRQQKEIVKLSLNIVAEPTSLDTRRIRSLADVNVANMIYEGLFRSSDHGPVKGLAESYTVDETETIYRFKLRKASWSNGKPITAQDFIQSYKASLDPTFPSDYAFLLYYIKGAEKIKKGHQDPSILGVRALDDTTLEFHLKYPIPFFLDILCHPIYFPSSGNEGVFNGPFSLFNWFHNYQITLTKNPYYWDKSSVRIDKVELIMCESEAGMQMFERGQLDWAGSPFGVIPPDSFQDLYERKKLHLVPACATKWIRINTSKDDLCKKEFRKAMATAIHRKELCDHLYYGLTPPAVRLYPASNATPAYPDGSAETARQFLQIAPQTKSHSLIYKYTPINHRLAQVLQAQLEKVGIKITLERLEPKVHFTRISKKDYDLALGDWYADVPDAISFLENFRTLQTGTNNTFWENITFKKLLSQSMAAKGEERTHLLEQAEAILLEESPIIPLFHNCSQYVKNPRLKGVTINSLNLIDIKYAHFSDEEVDNSGS